MSAPNDPLYGDQWHFDLIGGALGRTGVEWIWQHYNGSGVAVGVYDDGMDIDHEDLADNYDDSLHFTHNGTTYDGGYINDDDGHGTAVGGIIGAVGDNGIGVTGIGWGASLTSVNILGGDSWAEGIGGPSNVEAAINWAANFDVMNNSWGYTAPFAASQKLGGIGSDSRDAESFAHVAATGRDDLGTIIMKSAGNSALLADGSATNLARESITVSATDSNGDLTSYSNFGQSVLITAPAAAVTTDITGSGGYSSGDYTNTFGGTSASAPVVSGVVTLMLEANPDLGWRDVQNILAMSASQTGSNFGAAAAGYEDAAWFSNGAGNWNGGGASYSTSYGYGMVNAHGAVRMAEAWALMPGAALTSANEQSTSGSATGLDTELPQGSVVEETIEIGEDVRIESIMLSLDLTYDYSEDLRISLVAEDGTEFVLLDKYDPTATGPIDMEDGFDWTFNIEGARGMLSAGTWTLRIEDAAPGLSSSGTLHGFELEFFGSDPDAAEIFHFTDDFLALAAVEPERGELGTDRPWMDWLNLVAVTGDVELDMSIGGGIVVDGVEWVDFTSRFRHVVLGDGDNVVYASDVSSVIHGGYGDDVIWGGAGDDSITGGGGNDTIHGVAGDNTLRGGDGDDRIWGGTGNDLIYGDPGNDTIDGGGGNNTIWGGTGDNVIFGGTGGSDLIGGGTGDSRIWLSDGDNTVYGGTGHNTIGGGTGNDQIWGGTGDAVIFARGGHNTIGGGEGDNRLWGAGGDDLIFGGVGNDTIGAGWGDDTVWGGPGDNVIYGQGGNNELNGSGVGDDIIWGARGDDTIKGWGGDNWLYGGAGDDVIIGGSGNDTILGAWGDDTLTGGGGADTFVFASGHGDNVITDFDTDDGDILELEDNLWSGTLTAKDIVSQFAEEVGDDILFEFDDGTSILLSGFSDLSALEDHINIA